jgi:hypothetical protein
MLNLYSSEAPEEPPEPAAPVTDPELYPAQIVLPLFGDADERVGAVGCEETVIVPLAVVLHPPPVSVTV